jgi:NADH:ubiquinone oxidoreductase subunit 2 (subunit N)
MLGFISKWVTVRVGMGSSTALFILLLILGSVISLFYYLSLLFSLFLSLRLIKPYKTFSKFNFILRIFFILNIFGGVLLILTDTL